MWHTWLVPDTPLPWWLVNGFAYTVLSPKGGRTNLSRGEMWHTWLVPGTPLPWWLENGFAPRRVNEPESRGDVVHVVGARHSPPLVARERVRLDPVRPHPRTGQGLSRAGPAVHKVPAWCRSVVRVSPAPWRGRGPGPTVASHPWRSAVCGG